jgi:hypothetical protein
MLTAAQGLGGTMIAASRFADSRGVFAGIVETAVAGLCLVKGMTALRRRLLIWHPGSTRANECVGATRAWIDDVWTPEAPRRLARFPIGRHLRERPPSPFCLRSRVPGSKFSRIPPYARSPPNFDHKPRR